MPEPIPPQTTQEELEHDLNELQDLINRLKNEVLTQQQRNELKALIALIRFLFPGYPAYQPM